jgi:hypothetical protein
MTGLTYRNRDEERDDRRQQERLLAALDAAPSQLDGTRADRGSSAAGAAPSIPGATARPGSSTSWAGPPGTGR